jgi:hypothetical protein
VNGSNPQRAIVRNRCNSADSGNSRQDLFDLSHDLLSDATARARGLFDPTQVRRLLDGLAAGVAHGRRRWNLDVLELWFCRCVDESRAVACGA